MRTLTILCVLGSLTATNAGAQISNGVYEGFETDLRKTRRTAYGPGHLNTIYVQGDSVFLKKCPVVIKKHDTTYSASDGGYYYYVGLLSVDGNKQQIRLQLNNCDYCPMPYREDAIAGLKQTTSNMQTYTITAIKTTFDIDGVLYAYKRPLTTFNKHLFRRVSNK